MARNPALWGTKLGPRLGMYVMQAIVYSHAKLAHVKHKIAMAVFHAISDEISEEVDITLGPFIARLHDQVPEDHPAYPGIHFMHTVSGQLKAIAGTGLQISGLLGSVSTIMNNELADIVYNVIRANPALLPDSSTITAAYATGLVSRAEAQSDLGALGTQYGWTDRMLTLSYSYPALGETLELLRRGLINTQKASEWLAFNAVPPEAIQELVNLWQVPVSPADAALAVLRGNLSQQDGESIASQSGIDQASFKILTDNTGEPPGLMQLLEAYRRGFIDKPTLEKGILQSRYRNEWIPMLEQLRYEPMSVADAVNAAVQNQLSADTARHYADLNGLQPGDFDILLNTAGEPLSRTELEELYNRGEVTKDQVIQGLRESRLKNKYNELAFALHARIMPVVSVENALRHNGISQADAIKAIMETGYSENDAKIVVNTGNAELLKPYRDKVVSAVQALYEDSIMSADQATSTITGDGFTKEQADYIVKSSEFRREAKTVNTAVSAIRTKYLGHHITSAEASGYLDKMQVAPAQRDYLLNIWDIERQAFTRTLTEAQIVKAVTKSLITPDDGLARLVALGYSDTDATLLLNGA